MGPDRHFRQFVHFLSEHLAALFVQMQRVDLRGIFLRLFKRIVRVAELLGDHAHLLAQIVFLLALIHAFLHAGLDILFQPQHLCFPIENGNEQLRTTRRRQRLQHHHLFFHRHRQICGDEIGEIPRLLRCGNTEHDIGNKILLCQIGIVRKCHAAAAHKRFLLQRVKMRRLGAFPHRHQHERVFLYDLCDLGAIQSLHQHPHGVAGGLQHLADLCDHAGGIQPRDRRIGIGKIFLRDQKDRLIRVHRAAQGKCGFFPAYFKVQQHTRKNHHTAQRYQRQRRCFHNTSCCDCHTLSSPLLRFEEKAVGGGKTPSTALGQWEHLSMR